MPSLAFNDCSAIPTTRVARCPVLSQTVRYFGSLSGIKMISDNACPLAQYFVPPTLALPVSGIFERVTSQPYPIFLRNFSARKVRNDIPRPVNGDFNQII